MASHSKAFADFVAQTEQQLSGDILCMYEFGSSRGEQNPFMSDIDIFIIARDRASIHAIVSTIRTIEASCLKTTHSHLTDVIEENIFASNDYTGIHVIAIGQDELTADYRPVVHG